MELSQLEEFARIAKDRLDNLDASFLHTQDNQGIGNVEAAKALAKECQSLVRKTGELARAYADALSYRTSDILLASPDQVRDWLGNACRLTVELSGCVAAVPQLESAVEKAIAGFDEKSRALREAKTALEQQFFVRKKKTKLSALEKEAAKISGALEELHRMDYSMRELKESGFSKRTDHVHRFDTDFRKNLPGELQSRVLVAYLRVHDGTYKTSAPGTVQEVVQDIDVVYKRDPRHRRKLFGLNGEFGVQRPDGSKVKDYSRKNHFEDIAYLVEQLAVQAEKREQITVSAQRAMSALGVEVPQRFQSNIREEEEKLTRFALETNIDRWNLFLQNPVVQQAYGQDTLRAIHGRLASTFWSALLVTPMGIERSVRFGYAALSFPDIEFIPYLCLNFWREEGTERLGKSEGSVEARSPFVRTWNNVTATDAYPDGGKEDSIAAHFFKSLTEEQLVGVRNASIPGLMEVITAAREYPDDFDERDMLKRGVGGKYSLNNGSWRARDGLSQMCLHYLSNGTEKERYFVLPLALMLSHNYFTFAGTKPGHISQSVDEFKSIFDEAEGKGKDLVRAVGNALQLKPAIKGCFESDRRNLEGLYNLAKVSRREYEIGGKAPLAELSSELERRLKKYL